MKLKTNTSMRQTIVSRLAAVFLISLMGAVSFADLTIYTDRAPASLNKAIEKFQQRTGQKVTVLKNEKNEVYDYATLRSRLVAEGESSPADLILVKDLVYFDQLKSENRLRPMAANPSLAKVAPSMIDTDLLWVALSYRVRTAVYSATNVAADKQHLVKSYQGLASDEWNGKLCLRKGQHPYNQALISYLVSVYGDDAAKIVKGWMDNLATDPLVGDTAVLDAIAKGTCQVGVVNHYYYAQRLQNRPDFDKFVKLGFTDQNSGHGVHTNGTAVGILRTSKNVTQAQMFIEILLEDDVQREFAQTFFDYPAVVALQPPELVRSFGAFSPAQVPWTVLGQNLKKARQISDQVGYQ